MTPDDRAQLLDHISNLLLVRLRDVCAGLLDMSEVNRRVTAARDMVHDAGDDASPVEVLTRITRMMRRGSTLIG